MAVDAPPAGRGVPPSDGSPPPTARAEWPAVSSPPLPAAALRRGACERSDDAVPARPAGRSAAGAQYPAVVLAAAGPRPAQAVVAHGAPATPPAPGHGRHRRGLDRRQRPVDASPGPLPGPRRGPAGQRPGRQLPGDQQPPELGGHPRPAGGVQPPPADAALLPQARADLAAGDRPVLLGAGLPVHAAPLARLPGAPPGEARRRPGHHPARLRPAARRAGGDLQLRRGHPLQRRQAARPAVALPPPAAPARRRPGLRPRRHGRAAAGAGRRHPALPRRSPALRRPAGRAGAPGRGTDRGADDSRGVPRPRLRRRRGLPAAVPAVAQPALGRQGRPPAGAALRPRRPAAAPRRLRPPRPAPPRCPLGDSPGAARPSGGRGCRSAPTGRASARRYRGCRSASAAAAGGCRSGCRYGR